MPNGKPGLRQPFVGPLLVRVNGQLKAPKTVSLTTIRPNEWQCEVPDSKLEPPMRNQHLGDTQPNERSISDVDGRRGCRAALALYHNLLKIAKYAPKRFYTLYENRKILIKHLSNFTRNRHLPLIKKNQPNLYHTMMTRMNDQGRRRIINGLATQVNYVRSQLAKNEEFLKYLYDCEVEDDEDDSKRKKLIDQCPIKFKWDTTVKDEFIYIVNGNKRYYTNQNVLSSIPEDQRMSLQDLIEHPKYSATYVL